MTGRSDLYEAIVSGSAKAAAALTKQALAEGANAESLVSESMIPAMDEVGRRFDVEECFVPELMVSAHAMKAALAIVKPLLAERQAKMAGRVVIGTVRGDLHDIGKNLVSFLLEGSGFEVIDVGNDVAPERFIQVIQERRPQIVGLSALLTTTMPAMGETLAAFKAAGVREKVKVMIGGAPITQEYAEAIGADGFGANARAAVVLARRLMEGMTVPETNGP